MPKTPVTYPPRRPTTRSTSKLQADALTTQSLSPLAEVKFDIEFQQEQVHSDFDEHVFSDGTLASPMLEICVTENLLIACDITTEESSISHDDEKNKLDRLLMPPPPPPTKCSIDRSQEKLNKSEQESAFENASENLNSHDQNCLFKIWRNRRMNLTTTEEVRNDLMEDYMGKSKKKKKRITFAEAQLKCDNALTEDGHIMCYLKDQKKMFDDLMKHEIQKCDCESGKFGSAQMHDGKQDGPMPLNGGIQL